MGRFQLGSKLLPECNQPKQTRAEKKEGRGFRNTGAGSVIIVRAAGGVCEVSIAGFGHSKCISSVEIKNRCPVGSA
jgi:hypothetical protein